MKKLEIVDIEFIAFRLVRELMSFDEPIPDFTTRFPNVLESCLVIPFQGFSKKQLYKGLIGKASIFFYLIIKNHPFQNGNKRIAMAALFVFLYKNKKWIKVDNKEFYNFAVWTAQSPAKLKNEAVQAIEHFLRDNLTELD